LFYFWLDLQKSPLSNLTCLKFTNSTYLLHGTARLIWNWTLPFELPCARTLENSNQGKKEKEKRKKEIMCVIEAKLLGRQVIKCSQKPISCPLLSGGVLFFFFFDNPGCPGQLTCITTNPRIHWTPCKINRQVRYREGDMRAQKKSNLDAEKKNKSLPWPLGHDLKCGECFFPLMRMCRPPATTSSWLHGIINCD